MVTYRYFIILFYNRKKKKILHKSAQKETIMNVWREYETQKKPPYTRRISGKRNKELNIELGLIFPNTRWARKTYIKDELGRNIEVKWDNPKERIKDIIPYWVEERVFNFDTKKRMRFHELIDYICTITDIAQIFTLNNKLFVQIENEIHMFGNKNINDASRLFDLVRKQLNKIGKRNFIFVKDISTKQRINLYNLLEEKGYKRTELVRHYSY
jgi:hypothetical protein